MNWMVNKFYRSNYYQILLLITFLVTDLILIVMSVSGSSILIRQAFQGVSAGWVTGCSTLVGVLAFALLFLLPVAVLGTKHEQQKERELDAKVSDNSREV